MDIVAEKIQFQLMEGTSIDRVGLILHENTKNPLRCIVGDGCIYLSSVTAIGNASDANFSKASSLIYSVVILTVCSCMICPPG